MPSWSGRAVRSPASHPLSRSLGARLAMNPVTPGSEYWDQVDTLKKELEFVMPVADQVQSWDAEKKAEVANLVTFFEKDPEREKYMTRLTPADGR